MTNSKLLYGVLFLLLIALATGSAALYLQRSASRAETTGSGAIVHAIQPTVTELGIGNTFNVELGLFTPASNLGRTGATDMSALGASGTGTTVVGSVGSWPPIGVLIADSEAMQYAKIDDTHVDITVRGRFGTTAAQHATTWLYQVLAVGAANGDSTPNWALVSGNAGSGYPSFVMGGIIPHDNVGFETPGFILAGPLWTIGASSGKYTQIPQHCDEGEQVFAHDLRANAGQGPGAGAGGYVYCDSTANWKAIWSGLTPTN